MYLICGNYCSTSRDVYYLAMVEKVKAEADFPVTLGKAVHEAIAEAIKQSKKLKFDADPPEYDDERINRAVKLI
uniref:DUF911 domain-containing protein n=1 Tax=Archaeoglobus fulgidus TaxID=2234 RepID=A0A7J2TI75_ARCFL